MSKKLNEKVLKNLYSTDKVIVINAINALKQDGNPEYIQYLIDILKTNEDQEIHLPILSILTQLKQEESASFLVEAIENPKNEIVLEQLVNACWQNGLDYSPFLSTFTKIVIGGDYMTAFEAFTVIDNMDATLSKEIIEKEKNFLLTNLKSVPEDRKDLVIGLINDLERFGE